jgi:RNA methyltransferase, TrmH family
MRRISSRQNPLVARFRELARARPSGDAVLLEGEHLVEEALAAGISLEAVAFAESDLPRRAGLAERVERSGADAVRVPTAVMAALSPVRQPSGIVAIAQLASASLETALGEHPQLVVVLAGVQDAGNVGAIVRTADGCAATGIVATEGTADPFGWKALRGAMGSTFRMPIAARQRLSDAVDAIRRRSLPLVAAVPRDGTPLHESSFRGPVAILLGGEGAGLPEAIVAAADRRVTIPMRPPVESFNVAVTAALILYEASQQRRHVLVR